MGGKKGKKGARKTNRKRGGAPPVTIDWLKGFTAERVEPKGYGFTVDIQAYTLEWKINPEPESNTLTINFNGMGSNIGNLGDKLVIPPVKNLISEKLYGICGYDNMKKKSIYSEAVAVIDNLNKTSIVVFTEKKGDGSLVSCTIDGKEVPDVIVPPDTTGFFAKAFFKLKAAFNDLASEGKLRNLVQVESQVSL